MDSGIIFSDGTKLADLIRTKAVSPVEVVQAHLDRIEGVNPSINAIVTVADGAMAAAKVAEAAVLAGDDLGPLHGVPFTVKDSIDTAGVLTQRGSPIFQGRRPDADATSVARMKDAGGILLGKTNLPEFSYWIESDSLLSGRSNNPWDVTRTPGGSSGGESAAIAAGMSPIGLGTDLAISVRGPAAQTGITSIDNLTIGQEHCLFNLVKRRTLMLHKLQPIARPYLFMAVFFTVWIAALLAGASFRPTANRFSERLIYGDVGRLLVWVALPALWLKRVEWRSIAKASHPITPWSRSGAVIAGGALAMLLLFGMKMTRGQWDAIPEGRSTAQYLIVMVSIALLSIGEEFTFRGVFLSGLIDSGLPFWRANLIVAAAFALSHWPGWLLFGGVGPVALVTASLRVLLFGLLMGGLVRFEGGLVAAIIIHGLNDALAGTLF